MNFQSNFNTKILVPQTTTEEYYYDGQSALKNDGGLDVSYEFPEEIICPLDNPSYRNVNGTCLR